MTPDDLKAAGGQLEQAAAVEVIVGYLVTRPDGYSALIKGDRTRAENYAITHHAVAIEPAFVRRAAP